MVIPMSKPKKEKKCRVRSSKNVDGKIKTEYECEGRDGEMHSKTVCIDGKSGQKTRCPKET